MEMVSPLFANFDVNVLRLSKHAGIFYNKVTANRRFDSNLSDIKWHGTVGCIGKGTTGLVNILVNFLIFYVVTSR
jgi:hypothetical protein